MAVLFWLHSNHFYGDSGTLACSQLPSSNFCHQTRSYVSCVDTEGTPCIDITFIPLPLPDEDEDGLTDKWEKHYLGDMSQDQYTDLDGDGLGNGEEFTHGTDPTHMDSEGDGLRDDVEVASEMNPLVGGVACWWENIPGVFTVGETGVVSVDCLYDGGAYLSELGMFRLNGMEDMTPGTTEFIREAARRAISDSKNGHILFSDRTHGARFGGYLGESGDQNAGAYSGLNGFEMTPGDQFALILVPNSTLEYVYNHPNTSDTNYRPLFSLAVSNTDYGLHMGQLADVNGQGMALVFEDLDFENSDKDYNDLVFHLGEVSGTIPRLTSLSDCQIETVSDLLAPDKPDWTVETTLGRDIVTHLEMPDVDADDKWMRVNLTNLTAPIELTVHDPEGDMCGAGTGCDILGAVLEISEEGDQLVWLPELKTGDYRFEMSSSADTTGQLTLETYMGKVLLWSDIQAVSIAANQVVFCIWR